jgi:benzoate membrane transport protein
VNRRPITVGVIAALVGFSGAFTIVLAGLAAVGADDQHAASGLMVLCVTMGAVGAWASWRTRLPISVAWSTPGAALLVSAGAVQGGYPAALGAFLVSGVLTVIAGCWRPLARAIAAIPMPLASALLAGVLLTVCFAPARSLAAEPWLTAPVVAVWLVLMIVARPWAVIGAGLTAVAAVLIARPATGRAFDPSGPHLAWVTPHLDPATLLGLGLPLFIVTMASQNIAGMAVLKSFGYEPALRPLLVSTGAGSVAGAPFGAHGINLAAITAALVAGPDADADPGRRWVAGVASGTTYLLIGPFAGVAAALVAAAPPVLVQAVAGLALIGALAGALHAATADARYREAATITLVVSASGITVAGISAPFWGLAAGLAFHGVRAAVLPAPARAGDAPA